MVTASKNKTIGQIVDSEELSGKVIGIINEVKAIADKSGVMLLEDIVETSFQKGYGFSYETKTSFQRDYETVNMANEAELFGNTILRMGKQLGVEAPMTLQVNESLNDFAIKWMMPLLPLSCRILNINLEYNLLDNIKY